MFQRDTLSALKAWSNKANRKPLIIRGARQVGKTTLVKLFAEEFDTFLHLNLERPEEKEIFERNDSAEDVLTAIYFLKNQIKREGRILLFIDEIQNSPKAVALLRYFYEDIPQIHVIAAGSLLESLIDTHISFPVGRVEYMALRPCSFLEFLNAVGEYQIEEAIRNVTLPASVHSRATKLFNEYVLIGGMPEAVSLYADRKDVLALTDIYETILSGYRDDTEKYAKNSSSRDILRYVLTYGWAFAGQRVAFEKFANSNYRSREIGETMRTLEKAMLLELSYPAVSVDIPMLPDTKKSPKLFWLDTGLVNYAAGIQKELFGTKDIADSWRRKTAEHIVGQELLSMSKSVSSRRNFWVRESKNSQAEVDFLHQHNGRLVPVEVKSGDNSKLKSLHLLMSESSGNIAVRFWNNPGSTDTVSLPSGKVYTLHSLPFYYSGRLNAFLDMLV